MIDFIHAQGGCSDGTKTDGMILFPNFINLYFTIYFNKK